MIDPSLVLLADWMMENHNDEIRAVVAVRGDRPSTLQEDGLRGYQTGEIPCMKEMPVPIGGSR